MSEAEWKQEAERMKESHAELYENYEKAVKEYQRLLKDYAALYAKNEQLKADLVYANAILDDTIHQITEMNAELTSLRLRLEGEVKP